MSATPAKIIFGEDPEYDNKVLNLYKVTDNKEKTIYNITELIAKDKQILDIYKDKCDAVCIDGYSWSDEMKNTIEYYTKLLEHYIANN